MPIGIFRKANDVERLLQIRLSFSEVRLQLYCYKIVGDNERRIRYDDCVYSTLSFSFLGDFFASAGFTLKLNTLVKSSQDKCVPARDYRCYTNLKF